VNELPAFELGHQAIVYTVEVPLSTGWWYAAPPMLAMIRALAGLALVLASPAPAPADDALWALLRGGGQVVLIRHTITTPGVGDPPGFRLDDCATQRNLTEAGRRDASRIGAAFKARGVPVGRVLSSPWCRCLETARLAFGRAETWTPLNNLFGNRSGETEAVRAIREIVARRPEGGNLILVTHGSVVHPATGIHPAPGELVVLTPGGSSGVRVAGRLALEAIH
jgi:phosphohistidine phosphatase SixA